MVVTSYFVDRVPHYFNSEKKRLDLATAQGLGRGALCRNRAIPVMAIKSPAPLALRMSLVRRINSGLARLKMFAISSRAL